MKFGKRLAGKQLELPEYNGHFINYKALKKLIKQLSISVQEADSSNSSPDVQALNGVGDGLRLDYERLQENKASFFFKLERELEKVNEYYMEKEADLRVKFEIIQSRYQDYSKRGKLNSKRVLFYRQFRDSVKKFERDLMHLEEFVELNRTGFSKVLKKWDKRSHSHTKDFYLATVVSIQPIFTRYEVSKWNDAILAILLELDEVSDNIDNDGRSLYHQNNQPLANFKQPAGLDTSSASTPHESTFTRDQTAPDHSKPFSSVDGMVEIEFEIESWYMEALQISRLKDDEPKLELLESFVQTKVQSYVDDHLPDGRIDKKLVIKEALTKLFLLLVSSNMDDSSLKHFLLKGVSNIDLTQCDAEDRVFSRRNVLHEASNCTSQSRVFVLEEALKQYRNLLITRDEMRGLLNGQDIHGRTPLHYACERGKSDFAKLLVQSGLLNSVDVPDNDSRTPLVLSIINNNIDIAELLLVDAQVNPAPRLDEYSKPQFSPLSVACAHKNLAAAKLILEIGNINLETISDSQGLGPLHIVAKNGGNADLITLLVTYGADPNGVDSFNKWAPIFYAIQEGHATTVKELLKHGAKWDLVDDDNLSPLFYALWEGHLSVLNILLDCLKDTAEQRRSPPLLSLSQRNSSSALNIEDRLSTLDSLQNIPDFELPPPIIPLRKYGHNFLEKKIFVKIIFKPGRGSIKLNKEDEMVISSPGRITLTSSVSDIIPRNVLLPIQDDEDHIIVFQVSAIEDLSIDFELFPSFGTRLIAKTNAMPSLFHNAISQCSNVCHVSLPLFDSRLKSVGELDLSYQVIFPYSGKPLEITKYDTYWKSTSGSESGPNGHAFVTSSSLAGKYATIMVTVLSDGRVIAAPNKYVSAAGDAKLLLSGISSIQLESLCGKKLDDVPAIHDIQQLKDLLKNEYVDLNKLMNQIHPDIQLDIDAFFPTPSEINSIPVSVSAKVNINTFVDSLLFIIFSHIRHLNHKNHHTRSIVFSSCNPNICSILNWKQPNYPVMYQMNGLKRVNDTFIKDTPNHLSRLALSQDTLLYEDTSSRSVREAVNFASTNNMLGIIVPLELLSITPQLIGQIKHHGLLLIGSQSPQEPEEPLASIDSDINAVRRPTELEFKGAISM